MQRKEMRLSDVEQDPRARYELGSVVLTGAEIYKLARDAVKARKNSYAPNSDFNIGAAVLVERLNGRRAVFRGTNVENAAYGDTICAERSAVVSAVAHGFRKVLAVCVVPDFDSEREVAPCGSCRQVINEFAVDECPLLLIDPSGVMHVFIHEDLLSKSFGPKDLGLDPSTYQAGPKPRT